MKLTAEELLERGIEPPATRPLAERLSDLHKSLAKPKSECESSILARLDAIEQKTLKERKEKADAD